MTTTSSKKLPLTSCFLFIKIIYLERDSNKLSFLHPLPYSATASAETKALNTLADLSYFDQKT